MPKPVLQRRFTTQIPPHSLPSPSNIPPPDGGESVTTEFDGENSLKPVAILRKLRFATSFLSINPSNLLFRSYELQTRVRWVYLGSTKRSLATTKGKNKRKKTITLLPIFIQLPKLQF